MSAENEREPLWCGTGAGRGERGLFAKGNRGGPGNPHAKRTHELRKTILEATTPDDVRAVFKTLHELAVDGDVAAAKLWLDHVVGRPSQQIELTGGDGDPVKIDMANLTAVIMTALSGHDEARFAVARGLFTRSGTLVPLARRQGGPQMSLEVSAALELDPALLMYELGMDPDPWQARALRSESKRLLILAGRQCGKSTTVSLIALHAALYRPGSLILLVSRTERQSLELFAKIAEAYHRLGDPVPAVRELTFALELSNGSRIIALPGDPANLRGFSAPWLVIVDEGAIVDDALFGAVLPA